MSPSLRPVEMRDAYLLWIWANDPVTRKASGGRAELPWATHVDWLRGRLDAPEAVLLILETEAVCPVGTIRFETADGWKLVRLSYGVAAEARGQGYGAELLRRGTEAVWQRHPKAELYADVDPDNGPSRHLFEKLGWLLERRPGPSVRFVLKPRDA